MERLLWLWTIWSLLYVCRCQLDVFYSWKNVDFVFPNRETKEAMIRQGLFIPKNIAIVDMDIWQGKSGSKVFVTMPQLKSGIPATLATVQPLDKGAQIFGAEPLLRPYPEWSWFARSSCHLITSVFRVQVDDCGRLWVLDTGTIDIFTDKPKQICPPQVLLFDLETDRLIGRYEFPSDVVDTNSLLVTIAVDTRGHKCHDSFAYIADVVSFKLIVFDANNQRSWKIASNYFYPYPLHGGFDISGVHFDLMDGILGLAVGPMRDNDRTLYLHSLASVRESWVETSVIRNKSLFMHGNAVPGAFAVSRDVRPSQSAAQAMSSKGIMFFGLLGNNSIACWNSKLPYAPENMVVIAQDHRRLQFQSGLKIHGDLIWVVSNSFQNYIAEHENSDRINYRILVGSISRLTRGTRCSTDSAIIDTSSYISRPIRPLFYARNT